MNNVLDVESTLTDRYQTTVPETVRRTLGLGKRDKLHYTILPGGEVMLSRAANQNEADPVLGAFLNFLAKDIAQNPLRLQLIEPRLVEHIQTLVGKTELDLNATLSAEDE